jgi:hypothetical protein
MRRLLCVVAVALLAFLGAFWMTRYYSSAGYHTTILDSMPELTWLRNELRLTEEQFQKVAALHKEYRPECVQLCAKIDQAREKVRLAAEKGNELNPELAAALEEQARVHAECQRAMVGHIYKTAALMDHAQAERYRAATLPHALDFAVYRTLHGH